MTREQMIDEAVRQTLIGLNRRNSAREPRRYYRSVSEFVQLQHGSIKPIVAVGIFCAMRREFRRIADAQPHA